MSITVDKNVPIPVADGTILRADVYRPAEGRHPVLLQRTPYNKELWPITALTLDPVRAAAAGYAVVIQDVRARWASAGDVFFPYRDEAQDGHATVSWCAAQPFCDGHVGCYGLSYMGGTSWLAAGGGHPALGAISPTTAPNDFWRNHFWRGGALNLGTLAMWALRAIGPAALIRAQPGGFAAPLAALIDSIDGFPEVVRELPLIALASARPDDARFLPFFFEFLRHPLPDTWTDSLLFSNRHAQVKVPALIIAGWHDLLLAADLEHFTGMRNNGGSAAAREHTRLVVGPWAHGMFHNVVGELDFGFRANGMFIDMREDLTRLQLRWFDRWLKDVEPAVEEAPVKLFVQGQNRWRDFATWPPQDTVDEPWYLQPGGGLERGRPTTLDTATSYVYDPADPCPTVGGNILMPAQYVPGPVDQARWLGRRDVLCFSSEPVPEELELIGAIRAELYCSTTAACTDWVVKLCEVRRDGRTLNIADGIVRASLRDGRNRQLLEPGAIVRYDIDLWATAIVVAAGSRVRVLVTSSDFPRYDRNPNTGEFAHSATRFESALQRVWHGRQFASCVHLPVVGRGRGT